MIPLILVWHLIWCTWKLGNYYHSEKQCETADCKNSLIVQNEQYISLWPTILRYRRYLCAAAGEFWNIWTCQRKKNKSLLNIIFLQSKHKARRCLFLFKILSRDMVLVGILFSPLYTLVSPSGTFKLRGGKKNPADLTGTQKIHDGCRTK